MVFDVETTGIVRTNEKNLEKQPYILELAYAVLHYDGLHWDVEETYDKYYNVPVEIPEAATAVHGITNKRVEHKHMIYEDIHSIVQKMREVDHIIGHNVKFDLNMLWVELARIKAHQDFKNVVEGKVIDTMRESKQEVQAKDKIGRLKFPRLTELHAHLFGEEFEGAHNALSDVMATLECFKELYNRKIIDIL